MRVENQKKGLPRILFRYQPSTDFEKCFWLILKAHFDPYRSDRRKMLIDWME
ncbi:Uncharacterized protein BM_BM13172 [Brugia malayi]|uniref:Bm13172 n=1 Tax=Brugia malayi TaxID=6279 RepID=A0A0J9Y0Y3_BRUMA|nr:Uncharacterized protein BM_BM13172 [Brugia malayi]CDQ00054.1 Bm13172 [Brugia malayi]VIO91522.1 Uncharacterized protein BM_BM13172 [Brugia malayi]